VNIDTPKGERNENDVQPGVHVKIAKALKPAPQLSMWSVSMEKADQTSQTLVNYLTQSIASIRNAHDQLCGIERMGATPADLASRIKLYELLLWEISGVRRRLARDLSRRPSTSLFSTSRDARH
jgi:hypothetical protein